MAWSLAAIHGLVALGRLLRRTRLTGLAAGGSQPMPHSYLQICHQIAID